MESRLGMPSRTLFLEAGTMVGRRRNRSRSTRNRPVTGECITTGQRLEPSWFELCLSCCSMIPRSPRSKRTVISRATARAIDATRKRGREAGTRNHPRWSSRTRWFKHARHSSEHAVLPNLPSRGRPRAGASGRPCQTLNS